MIKSVTSASGKVFVQIQSGGVPSNFVNVDTFLGLAIRSGSLLTEIIGTGHSVLMTETPLLDIVAAAPGRFVKVTLGSGAFPEEGQKVVYLNQDSISGVLELDGQTIVSTAAMPAPMPVLETVDEVMAQLAGGASAAVAKAA